MMRQLQQPSSAPLRRCFCADRFVHGWIDLSLRSFNQVAILCGDIPTRSRERAAEIVDRSEW
jgi:hypothetical protein